LIRAEKLGLYGSGHFLADRLPRQRRSQVLVLWLVAAVENGRRFVPPAGCRQPREAITEATVA
jgi:hypothetical protein